MSRPEEAVTPAMLAAARDAGPDFDDRVFVVIYRAMRRAAQEEHTMTPTDLKAARQRLGLSQTGMAETLRLGPNGERTIRRWETGDIPVTGPASLAIELLLWKLKA